MTKRLSVLLLLATMAAGTGVFAQTPPLSPPPAGAITAGNAGCRQW